MFIGVVGSSRSFSGGSVVQITQPAPQDSGTFLYADYSMTGTENNRPPWVIDVSISGTPIIGELYTITCVWDKQSSGSVGTPELEVYRQDYLNPISGTLNRTLVTTLNDGNSTSQGTVVTTVFQYTIQSGDFGKILSFDFTADVSGVQNQASAVFSSDLTDPIGIDLPAVYESIDPEELLLFEGYDSDGQLWPNAGSDGGSWIVSGTAPTQQPGGEVNFSGGGLTRSITTAPNANWNAWCKFTWTNDSEIKTIFELSNNRQVEIMTGGQLRLRSTTNQTTSSSIGLGVEYNMICEHLSDGDFYVRVERNDGTVVIEETLAGTGTLGITSGTATICEDLEATNRLAGSLWELGLKHGTTTSGQKTDILTRLKSL